MLSDWHRLFGVSLADAVTGLPFRVIQELELGKRKQRLDAAVVLLNEPGTLLLHWPDLPDGLEDFGGN